MNSVAIRHGSLAAVLSLFLFAGCQSGKELSTSKSAPAANPPAAPVAAVAPVVATPPPAPAPVAARSVIRIKAAATTPFNDSVGNLWLPDQGFTGGETSDRGGDMAIANTKDPALYRTERYSMTAFSQPLPNGKYIVKLHFAETYEGIQAAGERVFSFKVENHEVKDFDVFARAGGRQKAYVETVNVNVADGKLDIAFLSQVQNPEINGIEIIPAL
jgi:endoglucanase